MKDQSPLQDESPIDAMDEQLVAYLDSELSFDEVRELEDRLSADSSLRDRLRELQNGWEMLDALPQTSSSPQLLETTIRMAAVDGGRDPRAGAHSRWRRLPLYGWVALASMIAVMLGISAARAQSYLKFRRQLQDLPVAMNLDAYLQASDFELMRMLQAMPEWQKATEVADRLGIWDFSLSEQFEDATPTQLKSLLPNLPVDAQNTVANAWDRFESVDEPTRQKVLDTAKDVYQQPDATNLLGTMNRYAAWMSSMPAEMRDRITSGSIESRQEAIRKALSATANAWTEERGRALTDEEVATVYSIIRQIGQRRLDAFVAVMKSEDAKQYEGLKLESRSIDPRVEAMLLRRLFDADEGPFQRGGGGGPAPPMWLSGSAAGRLASFFRSYTDRIRGPLREDELYVLQADLPANLSRMIDAAAGLPDLQSTLLRTWAKESMRRTQWDFGGRTALERYQNRPADERDLIDLLPPDLMMRSLQSENHRR